MASYKLVQTRTFRKGLAKLPHVVVARMVSRIKQLAENPFPKGARKLRGEDAVYRIRVGDYRIIYEVDPERQVVDLLFVRHRRSAYRKL